MGNDYNSGCVDHGPEGMKLEQDHKEVSAKAQASNKIGLH